MVASSSDVATCRATIPVPADGSTPVSPRTTHHTVTTERMVITAPFRFEFLHDNPCHGFDARACRLVEAVLP